MDERRERLRASGGDLSGLLLAVLDSQEAGVVVHAADGTIIEANATAERLLGLSFEEMRGTRSTDALWRCVDEDGRPFPGERHPGSVARATGEPAHAVMGVHRADGTLAWIRVTAAPVDGGDGGVVATFVDISREREAIARAAAADADARAIAGAADGFACRYEVFPDGGHIARVTDWAIVQRLLGAAVDDGATAGRLWDQRVHPEDRARHAAHRRRLIHGEPSELEYRLVGYDGVERWVWTRDVPHRDDDGRLLIDGVTFDVTRRHREQQELDTARSRLATVLETINEVVFELAVTPAGALRLSYAGPGLVRLLGLEADSANVAAALRALVHADDADHYLEFLATLLRGEPADCECRLAGPDGERTYWMRARPRRDEDEGLRISVVCSDVSERVRLRAELGTVGRWLEQIAGAVDDVLYVDELLPDGSDVNHYESPAAIALLGPPAPGETRQDRWRRVIVPEDRHLIAARTGALRPGVRLSIRYRITAPDGSRRTIWDRIVPFEGPDGRRFGAGVLIDITERLAAETQLAALGARLETLLGAIDDVLFVDELLPDGSLVSIWRGPGADALYGGALPADVEPNGWWEAAVPERDRAPLRAFRERLARGEAAELEHGLVGVDGVERRMWTRGRARREADGRVVLYGIVTDVTERRRLERDLDASRHLLETVLRGVDVDPLLAEAVDGRIAHVWSAASPEPLGHAATEAFLARVVADDRERVAASLARLARGEDVDVEYRITDAGGQERIRWDRGRPRRTPDGRTLVDIVTADVTALRGAEHRLQETQRLLDAIIANIDDVPYVDLIEPDGTRRCLYQGPGGDALLGHPLGDGPDAADVWRARIEPPDLDRIDRQATDERGRYAYVYTLHGLDGVDRVIWDRGFEQRDGDGRRIQHGLVADITERHRLEQSRESLDAFVAMIDDIVVIDEVLPDGTSRIVFQTADGMERLYGGTEPQAGVWQTFLAYLHPDDRVAVVAAHERANAGESFDIRYRLVGLDGVVRTFRDRTRGRVAPDGTVTRYSLITDETEAVARRDELVEHRDRLAALDALAGDVVFTIAIRPDGTWEAFHLTGLERLLRGPVPPGTAGLALWMSRVRQDDRGRFGATMETLARHEPAEVEYAIVALDGSERQIWARALPRRTAAGELVIDGIASDVTDLRRGPAPADAPGARS